MDAQHGTPVSSAVISHRPEIDGLRALAVVSVLLFHAGIPGFAGGYVGVDVFFVLSGYLIAKQLMKLDAHGKVDLPGFYERRFRRIAPAVAPCLLFTWIGSYLLFSDAQFVDFSKSLLASSTFTANIYFWSSAGYFDGPSDLKPLLHMWSLGVEVQFYIAFSIAVAVCVHLRRSVLSMSILIAVLSFICSCWLLSQGSTEAAFFLPHARFWEMLIGSVLALVPNIATRRPISDLLELSGIILIIAPIFAYDSLTTFPGPAALPATIGAAMVVFARSQGRLVAPVLRSRAFQHFGAISYSLYLWHLPLLVFARFVFPNGGMVVTGLILCVAYAAAVASLHLVEAPFRDRSFLKPRTLIYLEVSGIALALAVAFLPLVAKFDSTRDHLLANVRTRLLGPEREEAISSMNNEENFYQRKLNKNVDGQVQTFNIAEHRGWTCSFDRKNKPETARACVVGQAKAKNIIVMGDSNGRDNYHALRSAYPDVNFIMIHQSSCIPWDFQYNERVRCFPGLSRFLDEVDDEISIDGIIIAFRYGPTRDWARVANAIKEAGKHSKVTLIGPTPYFSEPVPDFIMTMPPKDPVPKAIQMTDPLLLLDLRETDAKARQVAAEAGAEYLSPLQTLCPEGACNLWDGDHSRPIYWDQNHFTRFGIDILSKYYRKSNIGFDVSKLAIQDNER